MPPKTRMTAEEVAAQRRGVVNPGGVKTRPKWFMEKPTGRNRDLSNCGRVEDAKGESQAGR